MNKINMELTILSQVKQKQRKKPRVTLKQERKSFFFKEEKKRKKEN